MTWVTDVLDSLGVTGRDHGTSFPGGAAKERSSTSTRPGACCSPVHSMNVSAGQRVPRAPPPAFGRK